MKVCLQKHQIWYTVYVQWPQKYLDNFTLLNKIPKWHLQTNDADVFLRTDFAFLNCFCYDFLYVIQ